jgi:hypothetical protein
MLNQFAMWDSSSLVIVKIEESRSFQRMLLHSARLAAVFVQRPQPGNASELRVLIGGAWGGDHSNQYCAFGLQYPF